MASRGDKYKSEILNRFRNGSQPRRLYKDFPLVPPKTMRNWYLKYLNEHGIGITEQEETIDKIEESQQIEIINQVEMTTIESVLSTTEATDIESEEHSLIDLVAAYIYLSVHLFEPSRISIKKCLLNVLAEKIKNVISSLQLDVTLQGPLSFFALVELLINTHESGSSGTVYHLVIDKLCNQLDLSKP